MLHRTVVVRLLSQGFPLPSWLVKSYKVQFAINFIPVTFQMYELPDLNIFILITSSEVF